MIKFSRLFLLTAVFTTNAWAGLLEFNNPTVRLLPPTVKNTAAFLSIKSVAQQDITFVSAASNVSEKVEFHNHIVENEMMKMIQVNKVIVPAQQTVEFVSGGLHLMLINLHKPLSDGDMVELVLYDDKQQQYRFSAPVGKVKSTEHHHHHHH